VNTAAWLIAIVIAAVGNSFIHSSGGGDTIRGDG
jgi:hypothetical protein